MFSHFTQLCRSPRRTIWNDMVCCSATRSGWVIGWVARSYSHTDIIILRPSTSFARNSQKLDFLRHPIHVPLPVWWYTESVSNINTATVKTVRTSFVPTRLIRTTCDKRFMNIERGRSNFSAELTLHVSPKHMNDMINELKSITPTQVLSYGSRNEY